MATDRGAVLTLRAAARGVLDCQRADQRDPQWWRCWRLLLRGLEEETRPVLYRALLDRDLAYLGNGGLSEESFKASQEGVKEAFFDLLGALRPWEGANYVAHQEAELERLSTDWEQTFGDLEDPAVKAEIDRTAANMKRVAEEGRSAVDEGYQLNLIAQARTRKAAHG